MGILGTTVFHKTFGKGVISAQFGKYVEVIFYRKNNFESCVNFIHKRFLYPSSMNVFLFTEKEWKKEQEKEKQQAERLEREKIEEEIRVKELQKQKEYIEKALGNPLTDEQCDAIFNDDDASLIVAGAGCGKTTTALGKIIYLVNSGKAKLEEILPIYFNNKNAAEMNDKITAIFGNTQKIAYDYHQLGLQILGGRQSCVVRKTDDVMQEIFKKIIDNEDNDKRYDNLACRIFDFIMLYMYSDEEFTLESFPSYFDDLSIEEKIEMLACDCVTLDGKRVKSAAEAVIANYLFTHKIPYVYEKRFRSCYPNAYEMKPDFYVPLDDENSKNAVWIEHWGIEFDSQGNERVRWLNPKDEAKYIADKQKKLNTYKTCNAKLIELFLSDFRDETLIDKLKEQLEKYGVDTSREMTREEKIQCIKRLIKEKKTETFQNLVQRCIGLLKINKYTSDDIAKVHEDALSGLEKREKERVKEFYRIVYLLMKEYERRQREENFIDYTDMLVKALPKIADADFSYKYIIIDEYQDIDKLDYELISAIQKKTNAKICCVGDDWQAIYRFKGGDIRFFSDFEKYFPDPKTYRIQQTFRNGAPLIDIAGRFIQKNHHQQKKTIRSDKSTFLKAIRYHEFETRGKEKDIDRLNCLFDILKQPDKDDFLIIVRNNSDFNKYFDCFGKGCNSISGVETALQNRFSKKIEIKTAHSSKGLEHDYVVVFNTAYRVTGFPSLVGDDSAVSFLLPPEEDYPYAEERRLFYVALTRAKKGCYLLVPKFDPSQFFLEIQDEIGRNNIFDSNNALLATCPRCGKEIERKQKFNETKEQFYSCSSYPACSFSTPKAFMVKYCDEIEDLIKNNAEKCPNRAVSIFKYDRSLGTYNIMVCETVKNDAEKIGLGRDVDIYVVFDNFKDYSAIKNCLIQKEREPVRLNFSKTDIPDEYIKNVFGRL